MSSVPTDSTSDSPSFQPAPSPTVSGKLVVLAMLTFGSLATGFLWLYTYINNQPFIPLRHALVKQFGRESSPRVEGGKERGRGPEKLRIVIGVRFDPTSDKPEDRQKREEMERETMKLARQHLDLKPYARWEFILIQYIPEKEPHRWESKREMSEVR